MPKFIQIDGNQLTLEAALKVVYQKTPVQLTPAARERIQKGREVILKSLEKGKPIYGINTGFGKLSDVRISREHLDELQTNLVKSHACGMGKPISPEAVRAILLLKVNTLAKGYSGVRQEIVDLLIEMLNRNLLPVIPEQGSVGASGDLAPLAHLALVCIGEGQALYEGKVYPGHEALALADLTPVKLQAKEGLALLNGTHFMAGLGMLNWHRAKTLANSADVIGAMTTEAVLGTPVAFDERIQSARGYRGQLESARRLRKMMLNSPIRESHVGCSRVQDPYSIRCMPQVHGAIQDNLEHIERILSIEINAATDNPLVFIEQEEILSGGNFHGQPLAIAMDLLSIVMAQLANMSERRIALMMDSSLSDLPAFLAPESGLNSGFMIAQVAAASLASENKVLSHPASVDSIPTSANKEDFVSMGAQAAVKAQKVLENTAHILAIELICACQSLDLRKPLQPGPASTRVLKKVRQYVPFLQQDQVLAEFIPEIKKMIESGQIYKIVKPLLQ